jgi:CheY-like chemotaxis protein
VLLDLGMPDIDGYEVARRVRATVHHAHVLLVALTGWGQESDQRRSRAAGFNHHIVKPPDIDVLRDLLCAAFPDPADGHSGVLADDERATYRVAGR